MKREESYERVLVFQKGRRLFFRKMIRFMDKYILSTASLIDTAPFIACLIANETFMQFLHSLQTTEEPLNQSTIVKMISEYSSIEVMRTLRNTVFTSAAPYFRDLVLEPKVMQDKVESIRKFYHLRFQTVFVKEFLIKLIAGLVKEP